MTNKEIMDIVSIITNKYIEIKDEVSNTGKDNHRLIASYMATLYIMAFCDVEEKEGLEKAQEAFKDSLHTIVETFLKGYKTATEDVEEQAINIFLDEFINEETYTESLLDGDFSCETTEDWG